MRLAKAGFCWKGVHKKSRGRKHDLAYSKPANKVPYMITCSPYDSEDTWDWQIWGWLSCPQTAHWGGSQISVDTRIR